jgi:peptidoglycan hydrolase-like protein with peptidoglycan-binding domain
MDRRIVQTAAATMTLLTGSLALAATPAHASVSQGYVGGAGTVTDDWGDEGTLSQTSHANSNATRLWQVVLWADGAIESDGTTFDAADIDCHFGPNTYAATRNWQSRHAVTVDGLVGPGTFGRADNNLALSGSQVLYNGSALDVYFNRVDDRYQMGAYTAYYTVLSSAIC